MFHYKAMRPDGRIVEGDLEAGTPAEVLEHLAGQGLRPVSIKPFKGLAVGRGFFGETINVTDKVFLTKYLALMLKVGTDLFSAIDILISDFDKAAMKALLAEVRATLEKGQPFFVTFARYPHIFSPVFVSLVKAGESSGNLETVFENLSASLEKEADLRSRVRAALIYPVILMITSLAVLLLLVTVALPKIADMFSTNNVNPPLFSKIVFAFGTFMGDYFFIYILPVLAIITGGLWYYSRKTESGRKIFSHFVRKIPVVKNVLKHIALQRFATTFSSLMRAGLPITESLEITAETVGDEEIKAALLRISREGVVKGVVLGEAFKRETVFPRAVTNLVAISEKAGHLDEVLKTLADFYESEINSSIKILVSVLEPAMLGVIGISIGVIALAIIVPIYQLVGQF